MEGERQNPKKKELFKLLDQTADLGEKDNQMGPNEKQKEYFAIAFIVFLSIFFTFGQFVSDVSWDIWTARQAIQMEQKATQEEDSP